MEGDPIKKVIFSLILAVVLGIFAGCGTTPDVVVTEDVASPFSIYRKEDGHVISIGDTRDEVAPVLGPDELFVAEFEEDNVERVQYWDNDQVFIDYMQDGTVCAMRFKINEWKIFNDLTVGMTETDMRKKYPEEHVFRFPDTNDLWVAYDEDGNSIEFSEEAPYIVRFKIRGKEIEMITVQDNTSRGGIY